MPPPLIQMIGIKKQLDGVQVLDGVNLCVHEGEVFTVIGKSGTGKSVLLKHIIGLMHQDEGELLLNGSPLDSLNRSGRHAFQRDVSYMFQDNALFDFLTVDENIALPLSEKQKLPDRDIKARVGRLLSLLGLEGINKKFPSQLSGGMRKRVAMARALITEPRIVLFDEPTTGLDPVRKRNVNAMIARYQEQFGFTAVIVSHDIPDIFDISQRVAMLDSGRILFQGTSHEIRHCTDARVRAFIRGEECGDKEGAH